VEAKLPPLGSGTEGAGAGGLQGVNELGKQVEAASKAIVRTISQETDQVRDLRDYNAKTRDRNPAALSWPPTLPIELALKMSTPTELKAHYEFTDDEWDNLRANPVFLAELAAACELVKQDGMSFRLKARMQAEELLNTGWRMIHAPHSEVPAAVKERLMAGVYRMAGFDSKEGVAPGGNAGLAIQINFNGGQPEVRQVDAA
jgi:hypothetical protein